MSRRYIIVIVIVVIAIAVIAAVTFVNTRPTVPDGGGADTNVGDSQPGNPDGGSDAQPATP